MITIIIVIKRQTIIADNKIINIGTSLEMVFKVEPFKDFQDHSISNLIKDSF